MINFIGSLLWIRPSLPMKYFAKYSHWGKGGKRFIGPEKLKLSWHWAGTELGNYVNKRYFKQTLFKTIMHDSSLLYQMWYLVKRKYTYKFLRINLLDTFIYWWIMQFKFHMDKKKGFLNDIYSFFYIGKVNFRFSLKTSWNIWN